MGHLLPAQNFMREHFQIWKNDLFRFFFYIQKIFCKAQEYGKSISRLLIINCDNLAFVNAQERMF